MLSEIKTKQALIRQWVLWAYAGRGLKVYFPAKTNFATMRPRKANGLCIDDDEGLELDGVVALLRKHNRAQYEVFTLYHLAGRSLRDVAGEMGHKDHKRVAHELEMAEQFFELLTLGPQNNADYCSGATPEGTVQAG